MKKNTKYAIDTTVPFGNLQTLTYVIATKRSGHHAFIEWMCAHLNRYLYLNNVNTNSDIDADKYQQVHLESDLPLAFKTDASSEFGIVDYQSDAVKHLLLSFENKPLNKVPQSGRFQSLQAVHDSTTVEKSALIFLRDPINSLASIARYNELNQNFRVSVEEQAQKWVQIAKAYFNPEVAEKKLGMPVRVVSYNDFIRETIACNTLVAGAATEQLDRDSKLSRFGGGGDSKFISQAKDLSVDALERRWEMLENPRVLLELFESNEQLRTLAKTFYRGFAPSEPMQRGIALFLGTL